MNYLTASYYVTTFGGTLIPSSAFDKMASAASDILDAIVTKPLPSEEPLPDFVMRAAAYEAETLYSHGGEDALAGITVALGGFNEKIGDWSIGNNRLNTAGSRIPSIGGIPVSPLAISLLRRAGYLCRVAGKAGREEAST